MCKMGQFRVYSLQIVPVIINYILLHVSVVQRILQKRLDDDIGMNRIVALEVDDPRRVSAHLAPIPPPPTRQIVNEQKSRFKPQEDLDKTIDYWMESNV